MSRVLTSPLGDVSVSKLSSQQWGAAVCAAIVAHALLAYGLWRFAPEPEANTGDNEVKIGVALGPPGGRLDPDPPPPPPPSAPKPVEAPPTQLTERAADSPDVTYTPPIPPAPPGAALSSGVGPGGGTGEGTAPPPPPPRELDPARMKAYRQAVAALIHEQIIYPERARDRQIEGRVTLRIVVSRRGRLVSAEIITPSGSPLLDEAIGDALSRVEEVPPLPADFPDDQMRFLLRVNFLMFQ